MELGAIIAIALVGATVLFSVLSVDAIPSPSREYAKGAPDDHH